jgi:hypothetical protein
VAGVVSWLQIFMHEHRFVKMYEFLYAVGFGSLRENFPGVSSYYSAVVSPETSKMTDTSENLENISTPTDSETPNNENNQDSSALSRELRS